MENNRVYLIYKADKIRQPTEVKTDSSGRLHLSLTKQEMARELNVFVQNYQNIVLDTIIRFEPPYQTSQKVNFETRKFTKININPQLPKGIIGLAYAISFKSICLDTTYMGIRQQFIPITYSLDGGKMSIYMRKNKYHIFCAPFYWASLKTNYAYKIKTFNINGVYINNWTDFKYDLRENEYNFDIKLDLKRKSRKQ